MSNMKRSNPQHKNSRQSNEMNKTVKSVACKNRAYINHNDLIFFLI